jgi:adenosylcobinamide-GDP ribazoletransferase
MINKIAQAVSFLTVIKLKTAGYSPAQAVPYFALTGFLIGLGLYGVGELSESVFIQPVLMLIYLAVITGALHLDGFIDSADALFSHRSRERKLEIMKDPHAGSMGITAVVILLIAKWSAFSAMDNVWLIVFVPAYARFAAVLCMVYLPYVRENGLGRMFSEGAGKGALYQIAPFALLVLIFGGLKLFLVFHAVYAATVYAVMSFYRHSLGGVTGDLMGAMIEVTEAVMFITAAFYFA